VRHVAGYGSCVECRGLIFAEKKINLGKTGEKNLKYCVGCWLELGKDWQQPVNGHKKKIGFFTKQNKRK